jgi:hypothetical protein
MTRSDTDLTVVMVLSRFVPKSVVHWLGRTGLRCRDNTAEGSLKMKLIAKRFEASISSQGQK